MKISVVINTFNAEEFLERVLESVKDFDEIIICDMYSTDSTLDIVAKFNCKLVHHERTGIVEPARAYAISQASNDWVLVVDADEIVTPALKEYLYDTATTAKANFSALKIPRKNYFMGRFMTCAYPDYILRFFLKEKIEWPSTIHAHPIVEGSVETIPSKRKDLAFVHLSNEPISVVIKKMNTYTSFEVERRKHKNYNVLSLLTEPFVRFLRFYLFKGGFKDGMPGFIWACMYAYYKFITIAKILESKIKKEDFDKDLLDS